MTCVIFDPKGMAKHEETHLIGCGVVVFKLIMNHEMISMDMISIPKKSKMKDEMRAVSV